MRDDDLHRRSRHWRLAAIGKLWPLALVVLVPATSLAVASISAWLVVLYLLAIGAIFLLPAAEEPAEAEASKPHQVEASRADCDAEQPGSIEGSADCTQAEYERAAVATAAPPRRRGRGRARAKAQAQNALGPAANATWVRIGPGKFVRMEGSVAETAPPADPDPQPSAPEIEPRQKQELTGSAPSHQPLGYSETSTQASSSPLTWDESLRSSFLAVPETPIHLPDPIAADPVAHQDSNDPVILPEDSDAEGSPDCDGSQGFGEVADQATEPEPTAGDVLADESAESEPELDSAERIVQTGRPESVRSRLEAGLRFRLCSPATSRWVRSRASESRGRRSPATRARLPGRSRLLSRSYQSRAPPFPARTARVPAGKAAPAWAGTINEGRA